MIIQSKIFPLKAPRDMSLQNIVAEIVAREQTRNILDSQSGTDDSRHAQLYLELDNFERKHTSY